MTTIWTIFTTSTKKLEDIVGRDLKELIPTLGIQDPRLDELMQTWEFKDPIVNFEAYLIKEGAINSKKINLQIFSPSAGSGKMNTVWWSLVWSARHHVKKTRSVHTT